MESHYITYDSILLLVFKLSWKPICVSSPEKQNQYDGFGVVVQFPLGSWDQLPEPAEYLPFLPVNSGNKKPKVARWQS